MTVEVTTKALGTVLNGLVESFRAEREKSEPFKELFKAGSTFTGLLRQLEMQGMGSTLDAMEVLKQRHGVWVSHPVMDFLLAVPYLSHTLERHIRETAGSSCCVDKTIFLLSEELKRLIEANPRPQP